jgi:hypothetical protein
MKFRTRSGTGTRTWSLSQPVRARCWHDRSVFIPLCKSHQTNPCKYISSLVFHLISWNALVIISIRCLSLYYTVRLLIDCPYGTLNSSVVICDMCSTLNITATLHSQETIWLLSTGVLILILTLCTGEDQLDAPDSPMEDGIRTDPGILDGDDGAEPGPGPSRGDVIHSNNAATPTARAVPGRDTPARGDDKKYGSSSSGTSGATTVGGNRPTLPPIYHTVKKLKLNKLVLRHLNGGGTSELDCTNLGASSSKAVQVGSFVNENDKRHNYTVHRHDHANSRNISFSFNPETPICTTCPGEHRVLRRTVEEMDVGMDNPLLFILMDQNLPPHGPCGGRRGMFENHPGRKRFIG